MAVSHALLVICYCLLDRRCPYQDLGANYFDQLNRDGLTRYFMKPLTKLGHAVTLTPAAETA